MTSPTYIELCYFIANYVQIPNNTLAQKWTNIVHVIPANVILMTHQWRVELEKTTDPQVIIITRPGFLSLCSTALIFMYSFVMTFQDKCGSVAA